MSLSLIYDMKAAEGKEEGLGSALEALGQAVKTLLGCESVTLLRFEGDRGRFMMIETWASDNAYQEAAKQAPKHLIGPVMEAISNPQAALRANVLISG